MTTETEIDNLYLTLNGLSLSVTALCKAIDPEGTHGPATETIVAHEMTLRETAQNLCEAIDLLIGTKRGQYSDIQEYCARLKGLLYFRRQPPIDNDHVKDGCEKFTVSGGPSMPTDEPKRVITGCKHTLERMTEWCKEGACPICITAEAGMLRERVSKLEAAPHLTDRKRNMKRQP